MNVFIRSALFIVLLTYLYPYMGFTSLICQLLIVLFNILVYVLSTKSNETNLKNIDKELSDVNSITH